MKLHIGCGSVYLDGWFNVDVRSPQTFLARHRVDLVEALGTDEGDYYGRHLDKSIDSLRAGPRSQEYVCDEYGSFECLPVAAGSVTEVLVRQSFEHLSIAEARAAFRAIDAALIPGGVVRIDVPDHERSLDLYRETGDEFYRRHMLGPRRDERGFHVMAYSRDLLKGLASDYGFSFSQEEPNIHFYPAFCLRFVKGIAGQARDYAMPSVPPDWKVLEVGPGGFPLERADAYVDIEVDNLAMIAGRTDKPMHLANLERGLPFADKEFDFVFCSHVLEHLEDPAAAAAELSRVASRGVVVMPSAAKEALFHFEEPTHLWLVLPHPSGGPPVFVRRTSTFGASDEARRIACRLYRSGPSGDEDRFILRRWFKDNERELDVVVPWENSLGLQVIR